MNNIRRFRYVKPIYKKSIILNNLKFYIKSYSNLVLYNVNSDLVLYKVTSDLVLYKVTSDLVLYTKPKSDLVLYKVNSDLVLFNKSDLGLILYQLNNKLLNYKSNKYLYTYILFKIAYFINFIL